MKSLLDLDRYPIDRPESPQTAALADGCRAQLAANGMFNLEGLVQPSALARAEAELQPLARHESFIHRRVHRRPRLHLMADALARLNVMEYRAGEALNWHFDRSEYTTTLLLRPAEAGGEFEYRSDLRTDTEPNYEGVAAVLQGRDPAVRVNPLAAGTLNVFAGRNTLHRVSPVRGGTSRLVAVFCYYERPDVTFSAEESLGFYGRTATPALNP